MKEIAVLLNPASGGGKSLHIRNKIEKYFNKNNIKYDLFVSKSESHLKELTQNKTTKYPVIIGVGGDTTFNIIVKEILRGGEKNTFGMIGTGSTNDFVRGLRIDKIRLACDVIKRGKTRKIDIGQLKSPGISEPLYFLAALSLGLGVTVKQYVDDFNRNFKIRLKSRLLKQTIPGTLGTFYSFTSNKLPIKLSIEYNNIKKECMVSGLAFLNTPFVAHGLKLIPEASPFDGKIDACIITTSAFFKTFIIGVTAYKAKHLKMKEVEIIRAQSIKIYPEHPVDIQADGFIFSGFKEFEISVAPKALNVLL